MKPVAVNFESEWMDDGSLRLRFLSHEDEILGQQIIDAEGLIAFLTLLNMAYCQAADMAPEAAWEIFGRSSIDADLPTVTALLEATRIRAGVTPEGQVTINATKDE